MKTQAVPARALQSWAKEALIGQLVVPGNDSLCELYCDGLGLDLGKYARAKVTQYIAVDPSREHLERTQKNLQLKGQPFPAEYIQADPSDPECPAALRQRLGPAPASHVCCFSGLHQPGRFDSERRAAQLLRTVHGLLRPGGFFMGLFLDSATVWSRTQGSDLDSRQGELYSVRCTHNCDGEALADGRQFGTLECSLQVRGEAEAMEGSLVHFPTFQRMAVDMGLQVCEIINLVEFYQMHKVRHRKQLIAYQVISEKNTSLDKPNSDVAAFFTLCVLQKKTPRLLTLETSQHGIVQADDYEPEKPHYHLSANTCRKSTAAPRSVV